MLWNFSANNTHLYPGALLRNLDASSNVRMSKYDEFRVEFSDGVVVNGQLLQADSSSITLQLPAYRTQRKTAVTARLWRIAPNDPAGLLRVVQRLSQV